MAFNVYIQRKMNDSTVYTHTSFDSHGLRLKGRTISSPVPKRVMASIPHSNDVIDQSTVTGKQYYERRTLTYVFAVSGSASKALSRALSWIGSNNLFDLLYDDESSYKTVSGVKKFYKWADVRMESVETEESPSRKLTTVTVTFSAYPWQKLDGDGEELMQ